jgi:branched-chain amino acid transport system ATP-binding protein
MTMLELTDVDASYGSLKVLQRISLSVARGEKLAIFGHNGAGKTTLLKCILGQHPDFTGSIVFDGARIVRGQVHQNARRGIGFVPQGHNVFRELSVEQNLRISGLLTGGRFTKEIYKLFPVLQERRSQVAGSLSGGQQQMLALGMALMTEPGVLLLDEPATGLAPIIVRNVMAVVSDINARLGSAVIIVEQNIPATLSLVDRVIVLKSGRVVGNMPAAEFAKRSDLWEHF